MPPRGAATAFRVVSVHFIVFANIVVSLHEQPAAFLDNFDTRIKGDTDLGSLDGPAFLGAVLNWHITGYFRALEMLENEVDRIDDAALRLRRSREERDLLSEMVKVRRRLALVRRTLLPHREVYSILARPRFAPFVTEHATETLQLVAERMERAIEGTENGRELILGSFDIFTTQTALRTNEVVKALTVISALLLPAGVIASLASLFIRAPVYNLGRPGFWEVHRKYDSDRRHVHDDRAPTQLDVVASACQKSPMNPTNLPTNGRRSAYHLSSLRPSRASTSQPASRFFWDRSYLPVR